MKPQSTANATFKTLFSVLILTTAAACSDNEIHSSTSQLLPISASNGDGLSIPVPRAILSARISPDELLLEFTLNGQLMTLTRDANDQWVGAFTAEPNTNLDVGILWSSNGISLARLQDTVEIQNDNVAYSVNPTDYEFFDNDNDSFTNLDEIDGGTDPDDATSFPGAIVGPFAGVFNANQTNCLSLDFGREATVGQTFTLTDAETVVPTADAIVSENYNPVSVSSGTDLTLNYDSGTTTQYFWDVVEVTEPGLLRISHVLGAPTDSFGQLYQRDLNGELILLASDDDSGDLLNTSLEFQVQAGGYCYILRHFSFFPIRAGLTEDTGVSAIRYELLTSEIAEASAVRVDDIK